MPVFLSLLFVVVVLGVPMAIEWYRGRKVHQPACQQLDAGIERLKARTSGARRVRY